MAVITTIIYLYLIDIVMKIVVIFIKHFVFIVHDPQ